MTARIRTRLGDHRSQGRKAIVHGIKAPAVGGPAASSRARKSRSPQAGCRRVRQSGMYLRLAKLASVRNEAVSSWLESETIFLRRQHSVQVQSRALY
jgi:hypothetical protein